MKKSITFSVFVAAVAACETSPPSAPAAYVVPDVQKTTDGVIARKNLDDAILRAERRGTVSSEIALRLERARFFGTYDDLDRADLLSRSALDADPSDTNLKLRASVLARLHRFTEATALLDRVTNQSTHDMVAQRATIASAVGDDPNVSSILERAEFPREQMHHYGNWAVVHAASGDFESADRDYRGALASYRDVSPMATAGIYFAMGVMWSERAGMADRGEKLYAAAVQRLPQFVTANVHLAEIEAGRGDYTQAIARLEPLLPGTSDPEPHSRLAEWYGAVGDTSRAEAHRDAARIGYDDLLERYPAAFSDHAAEFFLGAGADPKRALQLAETNLKERRTARAYGLLIRAARAAGRDARVCSAYAVASGRYPGAVELDGLGDGCSAE